MRANWQITNVNKVTSQAIHPNISFKHLIRLREKTL